MKYYYILIIFFSFILADNSRRGSSPYITGDSFRELADHLYDETSRNLRPSHIKDRDIIFVKTDYLQEFFSHVHPYIQNQYILITHNSDYASPDRFISYLGDEKIIMWFGQNPTIMGHPKFTAIPIGIANRYVPQHGNPNSFNTVLNRARVGIKDCLLGLNFNPANHSSRSPVFNQFIRNPICTDMRSNDHAEYLYRMSRTKFILSPRGNGLDCHRHWEAFIFKSIPIIMSSELDELLNGLPVLIIKDWNQVTEEYLNEQYEHITKNSTLYCYDKAYFPYWKKLIFECKHPIK
jgi:hypothetical protein